MGVGGGIHDDALDVTYLVMQKIKLEQELLNP